MPLTRDELARWAQECVNVVTHQLGGTAEFEDDYREALLRFVADERARQDHPRVVDSIERVLSADLQKPANRRGALPSAMGLVVRRSKATLIRNLAIQLMMDRLQEHGETDGAGGAFDDLSDICPYHSPFKAATAIVEAFDEAGIDSTLDVSYVLKIVANPFR